MFSTTAHSRRSNVEATNFIFNNQYCLHPSLKPDTGVQVSCSGINIVQSDTSVNELLNIWHAKTNWWWIPSYSTRRNRQAMSLLDQTSQHFWRAIQI